jgi:hypothetical protein
MPEPIAGQPAAAPDDNTATPSDVTQSTTPAAPVTTPEVPENNADEGKLSDEAVTYFKSQNIDVEKIGIDTKDAKAVDAFIAGHKLIRKENNPTANIRTTEATTDDVLGKPTTPATPAPSEGEQKPTEQTQAAPAAPAPKGPSQMDIVNMKVFLENTHKDVAPEKLGTKEFYDGMRKMGFSPVTSTGEWNVTAIQTYADIVAKDETITKLKAEVEKKPTSTIPDVNNSILPVDESAQKVQTMTEAAAANIIIASNAAQRAGKPVHPQFQEAKAYMEKAASSPRS